MGIRYDRSICKKCIHNLRHFTESDPRYSGQVVCKFYGIRKPRRLCEYYQLR